MWANAGVSILTISWEEIGNQKKKKIPMDTHDFFSTREPVGGWTQASMPWAQGHIRYQMVDSLSWKRPQIVVCTFTGTSWVAVRTTVH